MSERNNLQIRTDIKRIVQTTRAVDTKIEDLLLPPIPVELPSAAINLTIGGSGHEELDNRRAQDGTFARAGFRFTEDTYTTEMYGNEIQLDNVTTLEIKKAYSFDQEVHAAKVNLNLNLQARKMRVARKVFDANQYDNVNNLVNVTAKFDTSAANARTAIRNAKQKMKEQFGLSPQGLVYGITENAAQKLIEALVEEDAVKYNENLLGESWERQTSVLRAYLQVGRILILDGMVNTAEDFTVEVPTFADIYSDNDSLLFLPSGAGTGWEQPGLGRQPIFSAYEKDYRIDSYDMPTAMKHVIRVSEYRGYKVNYRYGIMFKDMFTA